MARAYYMGKRMVGRTPRHTMCNDTHIWRYPKAKDLYFFGAKIGHEYEAGPDSDFELPPCASWTAHETGRVHRDALEWQAEHRIALETRKAASADPAPELQEHVDALRKAVSRLSSAERTKFLAYLITTFTSWRS